MRPVCVYGQVQALACTRKETDPPTWRLVQTRSHITRAASNGGTDADAQLFKDFLAGTQMEIIQVSRRIA